MREDVKIFIASSGELRDERNEIIKTIVELNKVHKNLHLEPVLYELDTTSGNYPEKDRIQDEINPKLDISDIVIVLFYSKVGPFTLEEFNRASQQNKKVFLYFKNGFAPKTFEESQDFTNVLKLKKEIQDENKIRFQEYKSLNGFNGLIYKDLTKYLSNKKSSIIIDELDINYEDSKWQKLTKKDILQEVNDDYVLKYYNGHPVNWTVAKNATIERDLFKNVCASTENNTLLITGAGGEGKSTLLRQVGIHFFNKNYDVFFIEEPSEAILSIFELVGKRKTLLLVDNASESEKLYEFIQKVAISSHLSLLLFARPNEWNAFLKKEKQARNITRLIDKEFNLSTLSRNEVSNLKELLNKQKLISTNGVEHIDDIIKTEERNFFLAFMIAATQGKNLSKILRNVIEKIYALKEGEVVLKALGIVTFLEVLSEHYTKDLYCTRKFLINTLKIDSKIFMKIEDFLTGELLTQHNRKRYITRNPIIAAIFYEIIFKHKRKFLDIEDLCYDILFCITENNDEYSKNLRFHIPDFFNRTDQAELSLLIYNHIISFGYFPLRYIDFLRKHEEYIDENQLQIHKVLEAHPEHSTTISWWSNYQFALGNIGNYDVENSVKWILKKGIEKTKNKEFFLKLAKIEEEEGNLGDYDTEYSTKWILNKGIEKTKDQACFLKLAEIEVAEDNIGDYTTENSAKWILKKGIEKTNNKDCYLQLAELEIQENNLGDYETAYSAKWILKEGITRTKDREIYIKLAEIELNEGNIGDYETEYSAKWILNKGIDKIKDGELFFKLAEIELTDGNIGNYVTKNSAKWILWKGMQETNYRECFLKLAEIEIKEGNIGDYDVQHSARWILNKGIEKTNNRDLFLRLARLEYECDNIGDYTIKNSAKWILKRGIEKTNDSECFFKLAEIELNEENIGNYETQYSAKWILKQGVEKTNHSVCFLKLAELEFSEGNIGDYKTEYSVKWILKKGIEKINNKDSFLRLAEIELNEGNIGDYNIPYSAKWILKKAILQLKDHECFLQLVKLELKEGNIGDYTIENSVKWILKKGIEKNKRIVQYYIILARIEMLSNNIGSYHIKNSAKWFLKQGIINTKISLCYLLLAQIEMSINNIGDYDIEHSVKHILNEGENKSKDHQHDHIKLAQIEIDQDNIGDYTIENSAKWFLKEGMELNNMFSFLKLAALEMKEGNIYGLKKKYSVEWLLNESISQYFSKVVDIHF